MTFEEAKERARREEMHRFKTVYATSDGHFFINPDPEHVLGHSVANGLDLYTIKGPELSREEVKEEVKPSKRNK